MAKKLPVRVYNDEFVRVHGRQPRGKGTWAFRVIDSTCNQQVDLLVAPCWLTFHKAKQWASEYVRVHYEKELATGYLVLMVGA